MNKENQKLPSKLPFKTAKSVKEIINLINNLLKNRKIASYGVQKVEGVSIERTRRNANQMAIDLINSLPPDFDGQDLTEEQRQVLAGYTGLGGLSSMNSDVGVADKLSGGAEFEYYTPPELASAMWDMLLTNGANGGHFLEPSAGTGVFQEMKPSGVLFTSAEIDQTSGRINQLLHPEDDVNISPFEKLAVNTPDGSLDGFIGNVPFGISRGMEASIDPAYKNEKQVGAYILLRAIDKLKPNALGAIIVPTGMTDSAKWKKLREKVSRKAEFLGAHRMPSGTFSENGTAVVTDVWLVKKHPEYLEDQISKNEISDSNLSNAKVLWETFIKGKWFDKDGKRFIYGDVEVVGSKGFKRMVVKNDQIKGYMKEKLAVRFSSRINWEMLNQEEQKAVFIEEGDKRFIGDVWYVMQNGVLTPDVEIHSKPLDKAKYGISSYSEISQLLASKKALLEIDFNQLNNLFNDYPQSFIPDIKSLIEFSLKQKPALRERVFRGSLIGAMVNNLQDKMASAPNGDFNDERLEIATLINEQVENGNNPHKGQSPNVSFEGAKSWLTFKNSINKNNELSDFIRGEIEHLTPVDIDFSKPENVVKHLFSQIILDPITIESFRKTYTGVLPEDDIEALSIIAKFDGIAITPEGFILPMDRATSGNVKSILESVTQGLVNAKSTAIKENFQKQFETIQQKRKWTKPDDITFSLNDRWLDRRLILEFLQENGFEDLVYVKEVEVEDGQLSSDLSYSGRDGVFTGYRYKTVMSKNKETGEMEAVYKRVRNSDGFADQFENYLNGVKPRGVNALEYIERIDRLNESFNTWIRKNDQIDELVEEWNTKFNAFIDYEHSGDSLGLQGISGNVIPFSYQNSEVRRVSEDGRGIIGFGTGLGKTPTACALEAFNYENGRVKKTAFVVPLSVMENWYHEQKNFYSKEAFANFLFIGFDPVLDADNNPVMIPVLDDKGEPKYNKVTGKQEYKTALKEVSSQVVKERLNSIPYTNYRAIVMSKEQYASIPLREETISERAYDVLFSMAEAERVNLDGQKHRDAQKKNKIIADASDTGTKKNNDIPYFEDMGIDNVIYDEGHNYRNSYSAGREASQLAYMPSSPVAKMARDSAVKNAYLMNKNGGRGAVMLTATPLVNSPLDAFNMLSHVVQAEEWQEMGIYTPDDFVKVFGITEATPVMTITGDIVEKMALVGFKNLGGLRGIFHKYTTLKTIQDVSDEVRIPEIIPVKVDVPMTEYQQAEYEVLRKRADDLSNGVETDKDGAISVGNNDSIFSIIRDMDRLVTDPDMYMKQITFTFPKEKFDSVQSIVNEIIEEDKVITKGKGENEQLITAEPKLSNDGERVILKISDLFEKDVISRLSKFDLTEKDIAHPIPPKYSALIANLKARMAKGKQIIFIDEKTQHNKLRRIIASELNLEISQIGILNADTVAEASRGTSKVKLKPVKEPAIPKEDATQDQLDKYFEQKAKYDAYIGELSDMDLGGLESIASDYQEGRTPIIICNKKAEVGVNLHHGTVAIHHLTFPWTPASVTQREGRGARVGSEADSVESIFYSGSGSFDEFRIDTLQRKKNWIAEIMNSDEATMDNADANSQQEMKMLLASDPEERERMMNEYKKGKELEDARKGKKRALINLDIFLKAGNSLNVPKETAEKMISDTEVNIVREQALIASRESDLKELAEQSSKISKEIEEMPEGVSQWLMSSTKSRLKNTQSEMRALNNELKDKRKQLTSYNRQLSSAKNFLSRIKKADSTVKQLRPELEHAIKEGYLDIDSNVLDHPENFWLTEDGKSFRKGGYYKFKHLAGYSTVTVVGRLTEIDIENKRVTFEPIWVSKGYDVSSTNDLKRIITTDMDQVEGETDLSIDDLILDNKLKAGVYYMEVAGGKINKDKFLESAKNGDLKIKDAYIVCYDHKGEITAFSSDRFLYGSYGDKIIYPDSTDSQLQESVIKAYVKSKDSRLIYAKAFLSALFGEKDYQKEIEEKTKIASETEIKAIIEAFIQEKISIFNKDNPMKSRVNFDGNGFDQLAGYIRYGNPNKNLILTELINGIFPEDQFSIDVDYDNTGDFKTAYSRRLRDLNSEVYEKTSKEMLAFGIEKFRLLEPSIVLAKENIDSLKSIEGYFSDHFKNENSIYNFDAEKMFASAIALSLIPLDSVNEKTFSDESRFSMQIRVIDREYKNKKGNFDVLDSTPEEVEEAKVTIEKQSEDNLKSIADLGSLTVIKNPAPLVTRNYRFETDGCWCIQDSEGIGGALYNAKDAIKDKFSAKFYNVKRGNPPIKGAWWLIDSKIDINEILEVIKNNG